MEYSKNNIEPGVEMLLAYIKGDTSVEENSKIEQWIEASKDNEVILIQIAQLYYAQYTNERILARNSLTAYEKVNNRIRYRMGKRWLLRLSGTVACVIAGILLFDMYRNTELIPLDSQIITVHSNPGMRTSFNLPDGTIVHLNSNSTLSYPVPYDKKNREVSLEGEAFFKVTNNPDQPFIVNTVNNQLQVKVLGTEFNLQAYPHENEVETTLITGKVTLDIKNKNGTITNRILSPSEKATLDLNTGQLHIMQVNTEYEIAWIEGKLMFKDCLLPKVLKELSGFYNVTFHVKDPVIETYHFTGTFKDKHLYQVLEYLKYSALINYSMEDEVKEDNPEINSKIITLTSKK